MVKVCENHVKSEICGLIEAKKTVPLVPFIEIAKSLRRFRPMVRGCVQGAGPGARKPSQQESEDLGVGNNSET